MSLITDTPALQAFCQRHAGAGYIAIDTEFLRDRTYWPKLCLVQIAGADEAVAIDMLADGLDPAPLWQLMANPDVLKVFHAARQDIEIFLYLTDAIPAPIFDTQVAAMVCGFGEQVSYESLVAKLAKAQIDKTQRFTDWARRPLSKRQLDYALSDVIHLRPVYEKLAARLAESGRADWVADEMAVLTEPSTYRIDPEEAWRRVRTRLRAPRHLAALKALTAWREREAQRRDVPRNRVLRDETLNEVAAQIPETTGELKELRSGGRELSNRETANAVLGIVAEVRALPQEELPKLERQRDIRPGPSADLLKVLLKARCEANGVAQRLVATSDEIEAISADDDADVAALRGWRRELFGADALRLKHGEVALSVRGRKIALVPIQS